MYLVIQEMSIVLVSNYFILIAILDLCDKNYYIYRIKYKLYIYIYKIKYKNN